MFKYFTFLIGVLLFAGNVHAQVSYEYDLAGNRIKRLMAPDLSPTNDIDDLSFSIGSSRDFIVNIFEVNNVLTTGVISFRVTKLSAFTITYPAVSGISNVLGGMVNENGNWNFTENSGFITVTAKTGVNIPANGQATIGFNIARKTGTPNGTVQNITSTIIGGSGGEVNTSNNQVVTSVVAN